MDWREVRCSILCVESRKGKEGRIMREGEGERGKGKGEGRRWRVKGRGILTFYTGVDHGYWSLCYQQLIWFSPLIKDVVFYFCDRDAMMETKIQSSKVGNNLAVMWVRQRDLQRFERNDAWETLRCWHDMWSECRITISPPCYPMDWIPRYCMLPLSISLFELPPIYTCGWRETGIQNYDQAKLGPRPL